MRQLLRRLRGMVGNGLVWALAWVLGTLAFMVVPMLVAGGGVPFQFIGTILGIEALVGFASGTLFSVVLGVAYRNRVLEDIRPFSLGILGAAAGLIIPVGSFAILAGSGFLLPASALVSNLLLASGLGWTTSVGSLKLAQLAPPEALRGDGLAALSQ
jgi:hypothetical protein